MRQGWQNLSQCLGVLSLPASDRRLVIYSEGPAYWPHLGPVLLELLRSFQGSVVYVTSARDDPGHMLAHPRLRSFLIGDGHVRTLFFLLLKADVLLMTMPDLGSFHIKRPAGTKNCAYLHHSLVSSHMAYREAAFDGFDTILCAGPHHAVEIRAIETQRHLPAKVLVNHGYGRLDSILADAAGLAVEVAERPTVLLAPTWGREGVLERHADAVLQALAGTGWDVIVRPHPQTLRMAPHVTSCIQGWCARASNITLDASLAGHESLMRASVMISDWSGAALDFALGLERPVLFLDVPRKVNNPDYGQLGLEPLEVSARHRLGRVLRIPDLSDLPRQLSELAGSADQYREEIRAFRGSCVYNVGRSAEAAAAWLIGQVST